MPDSAPALRRVLPGPAEPTTPAAAYDVPREPHPDRPWVGLCMVTSLDGSVTLAGESCGLGNPNDVAILTTLRRLADMILVGAGTARDEGYGPPSKSGQRIGVVTRSGDLDLESALFTSGAGFLVTTETTEVDSDRVDVLRAGHDTVDLGRILGRLHEIDPGVRYVQAEGGPGLNGALLDADLVDELDLSFSPRLVGGDGPRLTSGASEAARRFRVDHLLHDDDGFVFGRYLRDRS